MYLVNLIMLEIFFLVSADANNKNGWTFHKKDGNFFIKDGNGDTPIEINSGQNITRKQNIFEIQERIPYSKSVDKSIKHLDEAIADIAKDISFSGLDKIHQERNLDAIHTILEENGLIGCTDVTKRRDDSEGVHMDNSLERLNNVLLLNRGDSVKGEKSVISIGKINSFKRIIDIEDTINSETKEDNNFRARRKKQKDEQHKDKKHHNNDNDDSPLTHVALAALHTAFGHNTLDTLYQSDTQKPVRDAQNREEVLHNVVHVLKGLVSSSRVPSVIRNICHASSLRQLLVESKKRPHEGVQNQQLTDQLNLRSVNGLGRFIKDSIFGETSSILTDPGNAVRVYRQIVPWHRVLGRHINLLRRLDPTFTQQQTEGRLRDPKNLNIRFTRNSRPTNISNIQDTSSIDDNVKEVNGTTDQMQIYEQSNERKPNKVSNVKFEGKDVMKKSEDDRHTRADIIR